jgi:hypothetical protein
MSTPDHDLEEVLNGVTYPAYKWKIISCAEIYDVDPSTRHDLYGLPARAYRSSGAVTAALGSRQRALGE